MTSLANRAGSASASRAAIARSSRVAWVVTAFARTRLALVTELLRLGGAAESEERASEERRRLRRVDAEPLLAKPVICGAERVLGGGGIPLEELDQAREDVGLE